MAEAHNMQEFNNFIVDDSTDYSSDNIEESSSDCDDDDSTSEIIGSFSANVDNTSSVAQSRGSRNEERSVAAAGHGIDPQEHHDDIGAGTREYGHLLAFDEHDPDNPEKVMNHCWVPVPALNCNCGADLKQLNWEEYCALVNYKRKTAAKHSPGRSPIKKFPFATTLPYAVQYVQFLQQKQKTVIYTREAPRHPGLPLTVPYSRQKYKQWKKQTNQFARYYLTAYCPEVEGYAAGDMTANPDHEEMDRTFVSYSFDWKALQDFIEHCQCSNSAIDKFHLMLMRCRMVGMSTSTKAKLMLTDYRNHNWDTWSQHQQRELKYQHYLMQYNLLQGGNQEHLDEEIRAV